MKRIAVIALTLAAIVLAGCDSPQRTLDRLQNQITDFKAAPDDAKASAIEQSFGKLDEQIASLEKSGNLLKADDFRRQEAVLQGDYQSAKVARVINDARSAIQGLGDTIKAAGKNIGDTFKQSGATNP